MENQVLFGPFRFDETNECLWRDSQAIPLRPKAFAVLKYLIEHRGTLVTKQQLLDDVWPEAFVGEAVLKDCIRQVRQALNDDSRAPQFIETSHRRGYRFIATIFGDEPTPAATTSAAKPGDARAPSTTILGRDLALAQTHAWLDEALSGSTRVVFVTGESGIGKTAFVEAFLEQIDPEITVLRGQCLEQYGSNEAYLPLLESFSNLVNERGPNVVEIMRRFAPTWLLQIPGLLSVNEREKLQENPLPVTQDGMLREMGDALEAITAVTPVVLFLEDLHWSDYSTLDLVSFLARRKQNARLLLIGTYRPVDVIVNEHPLRGVKQELQLHKLCRELPLEYLTLNVVNDFLHLSFPKHLFPPALSEMIHQRTEGNPLFLINVIEYLVEEKIIVEQDDSWRLQVDLSEVDLGVPENLRQMIDKHIERLSAAEQRVLEGASVVGMDCSAIAISAGLAEDVVHVEEICDGLARKHHFLWPAYLAELPDGSVTPRYRFIHNLYLDVLYKRVASTRRRQIHGRIGEKGESIYGARVGEIAAELALHFEQSNDSTRAVKYLAMAAENATRRSADHEAVALSRRGLELLRTLPASREHESQQQKLQTIISQRRSVLTSPEV